MNKKLFLITLLFTSISSQASFFQRLANSKIAQKAREALLYTTVAGVAPLTYEVCAKDVWQTAIDYCQKNKKSPQKKQS